jgi:hypothetical protein
LVSAAGVDKSGVMKKALLSTASDMGWPESVFDCRECAGTGYGVSASGMDGSFDKATVSIVGEGEGKGFLDTLEENSLHRTSFHGYDAASIATGEKVCHAGGFVGVMLDLVRNFVVFLGKQMGKEVNPEDVCATGVGTVAWTCEDLLFVVNSPGDTDSSRQIAESLYANAEKFKLCGAESEVKGRVTDGNGHHMPYVKVGVLFGGVEHSGVTDEAGNYAIRVKDLFPDDDKPPNVTVKLELSYVREGINYFNVLWGTAPIVLEKTFGVEDDADLTQNIDLHFNSPAPKTEDVIGGSYVKLNAGGVILIDLSNLAGVYYYMADITDLYLTILDAKIDYKLPVDVRVGYSDGTFYRSGDSSIYIDYGDYAYSDTDRPKNREYHEFSHHMMYDYYGGWPDDDSLVGNVNHDGYINPSTADSFIEGFAEFMAMAMAGYSNDPDPQVTPAEQYPTGWNAENNYKAWERRGRSEERAVAGYLWDLYDKDNEQGDSVTLSMQEMWPVLAVKRANFLEYHRAFKTAFPRQADAMDKIAVLHGLFADTNPGNGKWDAYEPLRDTNNNSRHDAGEEYVDYGVVGNTTGMEYTEGETAGRATNYNRQTRSKAGLIPNAFIKVSDTEVQFYKVKVHFNSPSQGGDYEYRTEVREGLLYLDPLPEGVDATISITPDSRDYTAQKTYTITSREYDRKYYDAPLGQGYFDEHTFDLKPTGLHVDPPLPPEDKKPKWNTDRGYDNNPPGEGCCCLPLLPAAIALIASILLGAPYALRKRE